MRQLSAAIIIATNAHEGQYGKGGVPYILHALKVMHYTKSEDDNVLSAAVLHDVIEDTKVTYAELRIAGINETVISAVRALTKQRGQTYDEYKLAVKTNTIAVKVKKADLRHNSDIRRLKCITERDIIRIAKYMQFYTELEILEQ